MINPCGCDCADCSQFRDTCEGCREITGKVYWAAYVGSDVCPIYSCCSGNGYDHCGQCGDLPCHIYFDTQDPGMTKEQHEADVKARTARLKAI